MDVPWLLATRSAGKLRELVPLFADAGVTVIDLASAGIVESAAEAGIECYDTFEANALAKARYFLERGGGRPVIADDSGLAVAALGGLPGVRSRRWSGRNDLSGSALDEANNAALVSALDDASERSARYVCVAAYVDRERELTVHGECEGRILRARAGDGGFGYDPYFYSDELGMSFGEATREAKQVVSHRGRAFRTLLARLSGVR